MIADLGKKLWLLAQARSSWVTSASWSQQSRAGVTARGSFVPRFTVYCVPLTEVGAGQQRARIPRCY